METTADEKIFWYKWRQRARNGQKTDLSMILREASTSGRREWTLTDGKARGRICIHLTWIIKPAYYKNVKDSNDNGVCLSN